MKEIHYTQKGFTNSNNEYVTIVDTDMAYLISQAIETLAMLGELTATSQGSIAVTHRNKELYGKRGKARIAPGRENTVMSIIGGLISNYYKKDQSFKNDISMGQLPYIANALNECCETLGYEPIVFRNKLIDWD